MAAHSSDAGSGPEPDAEPGSSVWDQLTHLPVRSLWHHHSAELARATAIDLAVLAGHMLLYPTGILPERAGGPPDDALAQGEHAEGTEPHAPAVLPPGQDEHPPVLLLHGFVDNRSAFALLRRSLRRHGWTRIEALNYSPLTGDIRNAAAMLGPHIERVCGQSGHARVDIVGHSLGGLVARYYAQRLGGDARVRTLVTMGTPHGGTRAVPALTPHPLARQMRPGSDVLRELAQPAPGCGTRFVAFWSDLDEVMIPVESARLDHPDLWVRNVKVSGVGHLSLPVHGSVAAEVRQALGGPGPLPDAIGAA
jgi:pimeloyl-ACP methyl ester carboxylesterase